MLRFSRHSNCIFLALILINLNGPAYFTCLQKDSEYTCVDQNLDEVPKDLQPGVKKVKLSGNKIKLLRNSAFKNVEYGGPWDTGIFLSSNRIEKIEEGAFGGMNTSRLWMLTLSQNRLRSINAGMWRGLTYVQHMDLDGNLLTYISHDSFGPNFDTFDLDLGNNRLIHACFHSSTCQKSTTLTYMTIS